VVKPFYAVEINRLAHERVRRGLDVIHMEVGQPSAGAPEAALKAAERAMRVDKLGYWESGALKERIARHYREWYGVEVAPERVILTPGASGALLLAFTVLLDAGDRVAMGRPGYPAYRNVLRALGMEPVELVCAAETRFQPTAAMIEALEPAPAALIVASPANPTGTMLDRGELAALVEACRRRSIALISDEIYHGISYGPTAVSALEIDSSSIVINSFSKYWCMTGWRLGWMVLPEEMLRPIECLAQNLFISPPTLSQVGGVAAFGCKPELDRRVADYAKARALLLERLPKAGLTKLAPADGAFYIYADVGDFTNDSKSWCTRLLNETGIAATPGIDFDPARGHRFVRLSFAGKYEEIEEACERLGEWLA
jgi:aspartate/methionine/tyrosine aminotransferase